MIGTFVDIAGRIDTAVKAVDQKAQVFIYGGVCRAVALGLDPQDDVPDYLIVSRKLTLEAVKEIVDDAGGDSKHCTVSTSVREFNRHRHFTLDQMGIGLGGEVAFTTRQASRDLEDHLLRPTRFGKRGGGQHNFTATLCGRAVKLANEEDFRFSKDLQKYIDDNWSGLIGSRAFRWHATKESEQTVPCKPVSIQA